MPTFLTTSKMHPELAARIEASVTGKKGRRRSASRARRIVSLARLALVVTALVAAYNVVVARRESKRALERARVDLLESVRAQGASLGPEEREAVTRVESWLARVSGPYDGDLVADELRAPGAFVTTLARPLVYVRGTSEAFTSPPAIAAAASTSAKDALVLCLLEPPESRAEKLLLDKVRVAYSGGWNLESRTPRVRRLNDAIVGLPFLLPTWAEKVRAAESADEVVRLRTDLERAPIERAKQAAGAELLLAAIDEPGDLAGPTELDGERKHPVRVVLVDLASSKVLLRLRRVVDPIGITPVKRATYATGIDSCTLALDVHEGVRAVASGTGSQR
jgi:hypothetical protein